jgi:putative hydrolase of the HAD superfamily
MKPAVLFDLGNTLAAYYHPDQFRSILETAIAEVLDELTCRGLAQVTLEAAIASAVAENREAADFRFRPMMDRIARIFGVSGANDLSLAQSLCKRFLRPIFAMGRVYEETLPVLRELSSGGYQTGIVSNAPWGSPPELWRQELERLGLADAVDCVVLCGDVGWRKPARQIFDYTAERLHRQPNECVFVGDDLLWDIAGSSAVGMHPILIDRDNRHRDHIGERVVDLYGVLSVIAGRT